MSREPPAVPGRPGAFELPNLDASDPDSEADSEEALLTETHHVSPASRAPRETLTVLIGTGAGRVFPLTAAETWAGRGADCDVVLPDPGVSRRHASVLRVGLAIVLRDNAAKNGTWVNGQPVSEHALRPGDEIQLGPNVSLLFSNAGAAQQRLEQHRAAREKLLVERMYVERIESLAGLVTGVAHEINTPLGVANTANTVILRIAKALRERGTHSDPQLEELLADLDESTGLMTKNLERASRLVKSFTQLSASQLSDHHTSCDLAIIVDDWLAATEPETSRHNVTVRTRWAPGSTFPWEGFPGHLSQVLTSLIHNTLRYAYPNSERGGDVEIRLATDGDDYRLELEDYGDGVPAEILPRIFEPFVTSGRATGASGLGLAITYNIVTNLLEGQISCTSERGKRTTFVVTLPRAVAPRSQRALSSPARTRRD